MYLISPFILDPVGVDGTCKLFTPMGVASIIDTDLAAALRELSSMRPHVCQDEVIEVLRRNALPVDAAEQFLSRIKVLREIKPDDSLVIFCASREIGNALADCIGNNDAVACLPVTDIEQIGCPSLLLAVQTSYSVAAVREIYSVCHRCSNCILLHAYFVFRHFVIDGFYSASMGLPDHFSGLHNLAGLDREPGFKPASWADFFLSDPYAIDVLSVPTFTPSEMESGAALHLLYTRLRPMLAQGVSPLFPDDLSTVIEMNFDTGRIERHRGVHSTFSSEPRSI